jgi:hypothetical protein
MKHALAILLVATPAALLVAQDPPSTRSAPQATNYRPAQDVWVLQMRNPPREYAVRLESLQTVTLQDYDMRREGKLQRVVEVTVETTGGNQARFFWEDEAEPLVKLPDELEEKRQAVEKAVRDVVKVEEADEKTCRVVKDYPVTTHGGWAEFKLASESDARELHKQLMQMWTGKKRES